MKMELHGALWKCMHCRVIVPGSESELRVDVAVDGPHISGEVLAISERMVWIRLSEGGGNRWVRREAVVKLQSQGVDAAMPR